MTSKVVNIAQTAISFIDLSWIYTDQLHNGYFSSNG